METTNQYRCEAMSKLTLSRDQAAKSQEREADNERKAARSGVGQNCQYWMVDLLLAMIDHDN